MAKLCKRISDSSGRIWVKNWHTFTSNFDYENLQWSGSAPKKNCEVSPCFLHLKILKTAFMGDMKMWSGRHYRHRRRRYRRYRRS
jgi:hypothetical protein